MEISQVKDAKKAARDHLDRLTDKELLDKRNITLGGKGDVFLFRPYGADLSKSDVSALWKFPPNTTASLKCIHLQKGFIHSHSFLEKVRRLMGRRRVFLQSPLVMY